MDIFEYGASFLCGLLVAVGIVVFHQDSYFKYLLKENLINIPNLIKKMNKIK